MSVIPRLIMGYSGTAPAVTDPYFSSVGLLLHGNGTNGSTTFTDSGPGARTVTANGNAQISTAQSKFGGASMLFDGTGDYLSIADADAFDFGTGDFTVETFVRFASVASEQTVFGNYQGVSNGWLLELTAAGKMAFNCTGDARDVTGATSVSANTWYHVAVTRSGTSLRIFVDGVVDGTATDSQNITSTAALLVGAESGVASLNGYLDELRITKGVARYTSAFTVPTEAFPDA